MRPSLSERTCPVVLMESTRSPSVTSVATTGSETVLPPDEPAESEAVEPSSAAASVAASLDLSLSQAPRAAAARRIDERRRIDIWLGVRGKVSGV